MGITMMKSNLAIFVFLTICSFSFEFDDFSFLRSMHPLKKQNNTLKLNVTLPKNTTSHNTTHIPLNITHITSTATTTQAKAEKTKSFLKKKIPTFRDVKKEKKDEDSEKKAEDSKKKIIQLQIDSLQKTSNETLSDVAQKLANSTKFIKGEFKKNLTAEEKKKNCKSLNDIIGNLTDFDINVSKLRTDFMTYTKQFLKKSLQME